MKISGFLGIIILGVLLHTNSSHGANIMFYFGMSSYSHRIAVWPLVAALAGRNHSITFVSPFPSKIPNPAGVTDYVPKGLASWMADLSKMEGESYFEQRKQSGNEWGWFKLTEVGQQQCSVLLNDTDFVSYLKNTKFDLVVVDSLANECAYGWTFLHGAKLILFDTANPFPWFVDTIGFPDEASWIPDMVLHPPSDRMAKDGGLTLWGRFLGIFTPLYFYFLRENWYFPQLEQIIRDKLDPNFPSASDFERNASLLLVNHHFGEDFARPLPPNVIPVGGMHCSDKIEPLPKDIADFLAKPGPDGKDQDFIYMSFGSYAEISHFPPEARDVFINTLKKLKNVKVIWKINVERPKDLPDNIYTAQWLPQQTILSHPKIRAFISHSGLLGIQEAICHSVPLIAFPIFAEQDYNANKLEWRKVGVKLEVTTITEVEFMDAIQKVVGDKEYAANMKKLSAKFRDRPARPVDTALWWTEYVLRHDDASHLRPLSVWQPWWKKRQLDIWAVILVFLLVALKLIWVIFKLVVKLFGDSDNSGEKKLKKN